ncbi:MAG: hypothetical protein ACLFRD_11130, partial [Nitriliruptoraceae bacterium]
MHSAGLLATVLITACVVPQVVAVLRSPEVAGVSSTAAGQACLSCAAWTLYALAADLGLAALSSGAGALLWGLIAAVTTARERRPPSGWVAVWGLSVAAAAIGGLDVLGVVLLAEAVTNTVPQARRARHRVAGISLATYVLMACGAGCWLVYAAGAGDVPLSASSLLKAAVCLYIVGLVAADREPGRGRIAAPPPRTRIRAEARRARGSYSSAKPTGASNAARRAARRSARSSGRPVISTSAAVTAARGRSKPSEVTSVKLTNRRRLSSSGSPAMNERPV